MHEVTASKFVPAPPTAVEQLLTPRRLIAAEGSFAVEAIDERSAATLVTATGPGLTFQLRFEPRSDGYYYEQAGDAGPFEAMETEVTVAAKNEGSAVTMRSAVALSLPIPLVDRLAGWKRRGELQRALDAIAAEA